MSSVNSVNDKWKDFTDARVSAAEKDKYFQTYRQERAKSTETRLRDQIKETLPKVKKYYEANNRIANGKYRTYIKYRYWI